MLSYLFWPNPGNADYTSPKALVLFIICALLIVGSFALKHWQKKQRGQTKKLSSSWSSAALWFGVVGVFLVVCRVEGISYLSMRAWWLVWLAVAILYVGYQIKSFKSKHYEVMEQEQIADPRQPYLPKKKKRK